MKECLTLDKTLIGCFRDSINRDPLIFCIYKDFNGKNKLSAICSAMDWIHVGVTGICNHDIEFSNTDQASIKLITYIACIDVMWEGISQLYRVFYNTEELPFKGICNIFGNDIDDNNYWKEIRAIFAAHPTNLGKNSEKERRYASWSMGGSFDNADFIVTLYSNIPHKEPEIFGISVSSIIEFAYCRYEFLRDIMSKIEEIKAEWCKNKRDTPIIVSNDILCCVDTLITENHNRLDLSDISNRLEWIKIVLVTGPISSKNEELVNAYKEAIKEDVQEILGFLQNMDMKNEYCLINDSCSGDYLYVNKHIYENRIEMLPWAIERLKNPLGKYVDFENWETLDELQVVVKAGWWKYNHEADND